MECTVDATGEPTPCRFAFGERWIEVVEVIDRWLDVDHGYYKLRGSDGARYILRHDVESGQWELTLFQRRGVD